ncbi:T9SS type A sorting domain-containing protein [bacterium]|nr:T9SS type A sorting domain-containing protein [bacterium]
MKKVGITVLLILGISFLGFTQSEEEEEYRLKINRVEDGVVTNIDTIFNSQEDYEAFLKSLDMDLPEMDKGDLEYTEMKPGDGKKIRVFKNVDVQVDSNGDTIYKSIDIKADTLSWLEEGDGKNIVIERIEETEDVNDEGDIITEKKVFILRKISLEELSDAEIKEMGLAPGSNNLALDQFKVYPNPSQGTLNVEMEGLRGKEVELRLKDLNGRDLQVEQFVEMSNTHVVMLEDIAPGTYFIVLTSGDATFTRKLIVL